MKYKLLEAQKIIEDMFPDYHITISIYDKTRCKVCGNKFIAKGNSKTCSPKCSRENRLLSKRNSWHKNKDKEDKYGRYLKQRLSRIRKKHENNS